MTTTSLTGSCPAWCVAHDPVRIEPVLHLSQPVGSGHDVPYAYRAGDSSAPTMVSVHLPEHDMTPQEALRLAEQLTACAAAALEGVRL